MTIFDYFEVNKAFAVVTVVYDQVLLDLETVNVFGGFIVFGYSIALQGTRIFTTLVNILKQKKAVVGLVAICNGGRISAIFL